MVSRLSSAERQEPSGIAYDRDDRNKETSEHRKHRNDDNN
jgi:hypothetical protein